MARLDTALRSVWEGQNYQQGFVAPRSQNLNPRDFYLWGKLKNVKHVNNPHDLESLKQNICVASYSFQQRELQQVS
jgi:hypothetical protein